MKKITIFIIITLPLILSIISGCTVLKKVAPKRSFTEISAEDNKENLPWTRSVESRSDYWKEHVKTFKENNSKQRTGGIVFLGDSITEQMPVVEMFPGVHVINRGIGGDRIDGLLERMDVSVYELKPRKIFILIGANDFLWPILNHSVMTENYSYLLGQIKKHCPDCRIYVQSILPMSWQWSSLNNGVRAFNLAIKDIANKHGATYINIHDYYLDYSRRLAEKYTHDGVHLNAAGKALWRCLIEPYMN